MPLCSEVQTKYLRLYGTGLAKLTRRGVFWQIILQSYAGFFATQ